MSDLRRVTYLDSDGRKKDVYLPEGVEDNEAANGVPIGPPRLEELGLPLDVEVRLNNELHARGILTLEDLAKKRSELIPALMAALKVDAGKIAKVYTGGMTKDGNS